MKSKQLIAIVYSVSTAVIQRLRPVWWRVLIEYVGLIAFVTDEI